MKITSVLGALALAFFASAAFAAETAPASIVVPWGDWLAAILPAAGSLASLAIAWGVAKFVPFLMAARVDQLLKHAIDSGVAQTAGAVKGREVSIPVANEILRYALEFCVMNAPGIAKKLGDTLLPKLIARLPGAVILPADASAANLIGSPESTR